MLVSESLPGLFWNYISLKISLPSLPTTGKPNLVPNKKIRNPKIFDASPSRSFWRCVSHQLGLLVRIFQAQIQTCRYTPVRHEGTSFRGCSFFNLHTRSECFEKSAKKCFIPHHRENSKCFIPFLSLQEMFGTLIFNKTAKMFDTPQNHRGILEVHIISLK